MSEEKLKLKIGLLNSKLREADDDLATLENKYIKECDKTDSLYKQVSNLEFKIQNFEIQLKTYEEKAVETKNDIILKDIAIRTYENKIKLLNNDIVTITEMNENLKKSLSDLEKYVDDKKEVINDKDNDNYKKLQKELDYERDKIINLHKDINTYKNECERLKNKIIEIENSNADLENKLILLSQNQIKKSFPISPSLEDELKLKKYKEEVLSLQSKNKGLNAENLKLIDENYKLRYESRKCFCSIL